MLVCYIRNVGLIGGVGLYAVRGFVELGLVVAGFGGRMLGWEGLYNLIISKR